LGTTASSREEIKMSKSTNTRNRYASIAALTLAAGLAGVAYAGSDKDKYADRRMDSARAAATTGISAPPLALDEVLARLRTAGYSDFREIERENGRYEVKGSDAEGNRVELYVDVHTGDVVKEERDD
jgi:uncharacterized membrane protein YkoI